MMRPRTPGVQPPPVAPVPPMPPPAPTTPETPMAKAAAATQTGSAIADAIRARRQELAPLVAEDVRLQAALKALTE